MRFHGYFGPFLVFGLRAGLLGGDYLEKDYCELKAKVGTALLSPRSCFIDSIQFVSDCTVGQGNLQTHVCDEASVEVVKGERRFRLVARNDVLKMRDSITKDRHVETAGRAILQKKR